MDSAAKNITMPHISLILAMSADGKISDRNQTAARFPSRTDKRHLETRLADADAVLFGAGTLRAYGTSLPLTDPHLLHQRQQRAVAPQPIHIVCSISGKLNPDWRFFSQPLPRWLLTTEIGAQHWQTQPGFDQILIQPSPFDWPAIVTHLNALGLRRLAVIGGGKLVAALVAADLIDEFWFTLCPLLLGGATAPTPMDGKGFLAEHAPRLTLVSATVREDEVFLHYRRWRPDPSLPPHS